MSNASNIFMHAVEISAPQQAKTVRAPVHHILTIDCSGSMTNDLPKMRKALAAKLATMLCDHDVISLIWFSGKNEAGVVFEGRAAPNARDLDELRATIDRWLRPIGLTGFRKPLLEAVEVVERVGRKNPRHLHNLFFLTDGCDNQWGKQEIFDAIRKLAPKISASTFVEYGYYADRALLTEMAQVAGGSLVFADQFEAYEPQLEASIAGTVVDKRIEVKLPEGAEPLFGQVFALGSDNKIYTFATSVVGKQLAVSVPEGIAERVIWIQTGKPASWIASVADRYAAAHVFMRIGKPKVVRALLSAIGDIALLQSFAGCYGKQKHTEVMELARTCAFDPFARFRKGLAMDYEPPRDVMTIVELLSFVQSSASVLLDSGDFKYSRIGRPRVDVADLMTDEQRAEVERLGKEIAQTKDVTKMRKFIAKLDELQNEIGMGGLKFTSDQKLAGYPILDLTWNENRANVSILVRKTGTVDLTHRIPEHLLAKIPVNFPTYVFRNYALVRDGMINVDILPLLITDKLMFEALKVSLGPRLSVLSDTHPTGSKDQGWVCHVDLRGMPVVNDRMVDDAASAESMFRAQYELQTLRCKQKVLKDFRKGAGTLGDGLEPNLVARYGEDGAEFLSSIGISRNGFAPVSTKQAEKKDFYMGVELDITLAGLMTLPSINEVNKRVAGKKPLTGATALMAEEISRINAIKATLDADGFAAWVESATAEVIKETRAAIRSLARLKYGIILGQVWFTEFQAHGEGTLVMNLGGADVSCTATLVDVEIDL